MTFKPSIYGLLVGLAVLIFWQLSEARAKKIGFKHELFTRFGLAFGVGALVGARAWHVLTDLTSYLGNWWYVIAIWRGGLSIWGAFWGGIISVAGLVYFSLKKSRTNADTNWDKFWQFLDVLSPSLPIAQAIGRLGNWYNQELYGLPSKLPWALYIDPQHRLPGYQQVETYHPLFAYEIIGLTILWALLWLLPEQSPTGFRFIFYLSGYTLIRFCLDFIRLDQLMLPFGYLSANQVASVLLLLLFVTSRKLLYK